jgi:FkbM family methyltransferase
MDWLERHIAIFEAPESILHIGAGSGADLPAYDRVPSSRLILLEPLPDLAARLRRMTAGNDRVTVVQAAVGAKEGHARLHRFNQPLYSSLHNPGRLLELFPGLTRVAELEVETHTLSSLVDMLNLQTGHDNWLVVDAPGAESTILGELARWEETPLFTHVFLRAGTESLYEGAEPLDRLVVKLEDEGYHQVGAPDLADMDWPGLHFEKGPAHDEALELIDTVEALKARAKDLAERRGELEDALEQQRKDFEHRVAQLSHRLADREKELDRLVEEVRQGTDREQALEAEKRAAAEKAEQLARQFESRRDKLQSELEEARADLSVSLRVQALREADLKELQERYGELTALKNRQHELLLQLGQRLGAASEYLQALKAPDGSADSSSASEGLVHALAGDLGSDR